MAGFPAIDGTFADPNLAMFGDRFYLYPTTDGLPDWGSRSFRAFSSDDLSEWVDHGEVLTLGADVPWASGHAWAPTIARGGDRYFLYFSAAEDNIGVAEGPTPLGPFVDKGSPLVAAGEYPGTAIDPSTFVDDDGRTYLLWGNQFAHLVPLNDDMMSFDRRAVVSWQPTDFREAPWLHRHGDTYYLSWSVNDTREVDYLVRYATGPSPYGPWTDRGILVQQRPEIGIYGTGHHSIIRSDSYGWLIAYHRFAMPDGNGYRREIIVDRLVHTDDDLLEPVVPAIESFRPKH